MAKSPFCSLRKRRTVIIPGLPTDLAEFYSLHEGVGLQASPNRSVRLCRLSQLKRMKWKDLHHFGEQEPEGGWEKFDAFKIGMGTYFEEIFYVLRAPCCCTGAILEIGGLAPGPGGFAPNDFESTLVLAPSLREWLSNLERWGWEEHAICGIGGLPKRQQKELLKYYLALNPNMNVG